MRDNDARDRLQAEAVETLISRRRLIVNWGTGVGKSRVAVSALDRLAGPGCERILLLVAETAHKENWHKEFTHALGDRGETLWNMMTVECYASLKKYEGTEWDVIIADEAHHLRSDDRTYYISTLKATYVLCLSATLSERGDGDGLTRTLEDTFGKFQHRHFTLQQSIDANVLGEPEIIVHVLPLRDGEQDQEVKLAWGFPRARRKIRCTYEQAGEYLDNKDRWRDVELTVRCSPRQGYVLLCDQIDQAKHEYMEAYHNAQGVFADTADDKKLEYLHNAWMLLGSKRKAFLGRCKTRFARWLIRQLEGQKFICFCSDVAQGETLGGDRVVNAKRRDNAAVIKAFNEDESRSLFAVGMLQEGVSLHGIEAGIVLQLGGKERVFVQKFGRAMRAENPVQHIVIFNNTHDVDYYRTAVENIDKKYIRFRNYDPDDPMI